MGEEAYEVELFGGEEERVMEWEAGLPGAEELTPLSQPLVPPGLAAAFRIPPEPGRTLLDVHRASAATVSRLRSSSNSNSSGGSGGGGSFQPLSNHHQEEQGSAADASNNTTTSTSKRPRLVWTPQLHKRFVEVVAHLGIKSAVPKTIMQLMNVEGLTRENVASHLQKYRLYVKRMQGLSNEGPSPSDHIFASTPVPHSLVHEPQAAPVPYAVAVGINHHHAYYHHGYYHADK
ncbi:unnamed protein product [Urochloa humidicola]